MLIKCVTACQGFDGPDFDFCIVDCTQEQYDNGDHYDAANDHARENYDGPFISYDENDNPKFLFEHFVWESADTIKVGE